MTSKYNVEYWNSGNAFVSNLQYMSKVAHGFEHMSTFGESPYSNDFQCLNIRWASNQPK